MGSFRNGPQASGAWKSLSDAEWRVVELLCKGLTNPQIGERLYISRRTVQSHLYNIFRKLGVKSRTELVARAIQAGFGRGDEKRDG